MRLPANPSHTPTTTPILPRRLTRSRAAAITPGAALAGRTTSTSGITWAGLNEVQSEHALGMDGPRGQLLDVEARRVRGQDRVGPAHGIEALEHARAVSISSNTASRRRPRRSAVVGHASTRRSRDSISTTESRPLAPRVRYVCSTFARPRHRLRRGAEHAQSGRPRSRTPSRCRFPSCRTRPRRPSGSGAPRCARERRAPCARPARRRTRRNAGLRPGQELEEHLALAEEGLVERKGERHPTAGQLPLAARWPGARSAREVRLPALEGSRLRDGDGQAARGAAGAPTPLPPRAGQRRAPARRGRRVERPRRRDRAPALRPLRRDGR